MQDALLRLKSVDPLVKLQLNVLPILGDKGKNNELTNESKEELMESVQKILIWLGDLSRYHNDLEISNSVITPERFYHQASKSQIIFFCRMSFYLLLLLGNSCESWYWSPLQPTWDFD